MSEFKLKSLEQLGISIERKQSIERENMSSIFVSFEDPIERAVYLNFILQGEGELDRIRSIDSNRLLIENVAQKVKDEKKIYTKEEFEKWLYGIDEIKLVKFKSLIKDIGESKKVQVKAGSINPFKIIFGINITNSYIYTIMKESVTNGDFNSHEKSLFNELAASINKAIENNFAEEFYYDKNSSTNEIDCVGMEKIIEYGKRNKYEGRKILFWSLMIIAIDENLYNEKIDVVADMAYLFKFSEEMLEDWITGVKLILQGEELKEKFRTHEAAEFFLG